MIGCYFFMIENDFLVIGCYFFVDGHHNWARRDEPLPRRDGQKKALLHRLQQPIQIPPDDLRVRMLIP